MCGLDAGATGIIAIVDTAEALLGLAGFRGARLIGLAWDAASLCADIGAERYRGGLVGSVGPYHLARDLTLLAATAAGVAAIDAAFVDARDEEGLRAEALAARRAGFAGKMAIDPVQAPIINDVFPSRSISPTLPSS